MYKNKKMQLWRKKGSIKDTSRTKEGGRSSGGQQQLRLLPDLKVKRKRARPFHSTLTEANARLQWV